MKPKRNFEDVVAALAKGLESGEITLWCENEDIASKLLEQFETLDFHVREALSLLSVTTSGKETFALLASIEQRIDTVATWYRTLMREIATAAVANKRDG